MKSLQLMMILINCKDLLIKCAWITELSLGTINETSRKGYLFHQSFRYCSQNKNEREKCVDDFIDGDDTIIGNVYWE